LKVSFTTKRFQDYGTPEEAVAPLIPFLEKMDYNVVWEPACGDGFIYNVLRRYGFEVVCTDKRFGKNFFDSEPSIDYDVIITNPPFDKRGWFVKRCVDLRKPWCLLMPLFSFDKLTVAHLNRVRFELLILSKRIKFIENRVKMKNNAPFSVGWFCHMVLPQRIIIF